MKSQSKEPNANIRDWINKELKGIDNFSNRITTHEKMICLNPTNISTTNIDEHFLSSVQLVNINIDETTTLNDLIHQQHKRQKIFSA